MKFFVKGLLFGVSLYATPAKSVAVKRDDASWAKGYDYVSLDATILLR
jgi:hypothetical protein